MGNLLTWKFWFNLRPGILAAGPQKILSYFVILLTIALFVFGFIKSRQKKGLYIKLWERLYYFCLANAIIGALLLFFNYEMIPFLTARFWFLFWAIGIGVWLFFIIKTTIKIPQRRKRLEQEKEFKKYIP
ncbi:hypothetical protein CO116_02290 [Candidatus Falkowbacteria bacterium CG_4_9_14_3_um_filter_38_19]|uniref:Uncharacterized protein n=2 Tax=Candidatus Falkowiibacteriota TaxID=1752728 RepID=A0A2M6WPH7_9BACT|nr:hypothetical protein [Candidatus Falkowbacteria bacterium]PIT94689.1 MAG: hypothetical protein COT96_02880 [Candidatus Falkowbacteria bacterium CG10_big_fil_rev_8_21_14_0_10_38_22]PJB16348.1 MAG: hypothetical protein CO116_02290 [Candidatus Falkowbacteria bacterium CG_4_9_14_3_um_filter_38_19]